MREPELTINAEGDDSFASLYALIESGQIKSLTDLQSRLESPTEKTLVKAASLVSTFDEALFNEVLQLLPSPNSPKVSFDQFIRNANVEEVPRTDRMFRIKDVAREESLRQWHKELTSDKTLIQSQFFTKILEHYQKFGDLEHLGLLVVTESKEAASIFNDLFDGADRHFDLARCNDILKVLDDRIDFLTDELADLLAEKHKYLNARNLFAGDYYQSAFYYARSSVVTSFRELLKADAKPRAEWIFQLYAKGGMGKTMFVKWLLARHCVPNKIPIARIDFDFIHLPTAIRFPTLLLLAIANQINMQIPDSALESYLSNYFNFLSLLRPPDGGTNEDRQRKQKRFKEIEPQLRDSIAGRFTAALNESSLKNNVIVVFDTLEQMSLNRTQVLLAVLKQMKQIHDVYPRLRLLLSGRYNLDEQSTKFKADFSKYTVTHKLEPFTRREARAYLKGNRSLSNRAIVSAIVKKCKEEPSEKDKKSTSKGTAPNEAFNPFKLSLFVDLYQQREVESVADILSYPRTDIEYLIERIVKRIKEPTVQWLLRYAAIPRQFTYEIFDKVLASHMEQELIKNRQWDQVNQKFPKGAESFNNQKNWKDYKSNRSKKLNRRAIWNNLRKYASGYSFISFDMGDDSAPRLQPEVTVPMRRLLEEQDIFPNLHEDLEKFFLQKAAKQSDPLQRAQQLTETIYHWFQRKGAKAAEYWRDLLDNDESRRYPRVRKILAEEILGSDYIDDSGEPIPKYTGAVRVERETLREAYLRTIEATMATTANLKSSDRPATWEEISQRLEELQRLDHRHPKVKLQQTIQLDTHLMRRLASLLRQGRGVVKTSAIIRLLSQAITSAPSEQTEIALRLQLADALASEDNPQCLAQYNKILKLVRSVKFSQIPASGVLLKIGLWHQQQGDLAVAQRTYRQALARADKGKHPSIIQNAHRYLADISLELGRYDEALRLLDKVKKGRAKNAKPSIVDTLLVSQIKGRSLYQPLHALAEIEPLLQIDTTITERAPLKELNGDLFGQLMRFEDALELLEEAKNLWVSATNPESADRVRILRIELQLFDIGNLDEADYLLNVSEDLSTKSSSEIVSHLKLLRVFWAYKKGDRVQAMRIWKQVLSSRRFTSDTENEIRILATGLALGLGDAKTVRRFSRLFGSIDPVSRLSLLRPFAFGHEPFKGTGAQKQAIAKLVTIPLQGKDMIPHALQCANVLAWCGAESTAKRYLNRAAREALRIKNSFAYRQILLTKDRLDFTNPRTDVLAKSKFLKDYAAYPILCGAALFEQAQRYFRHSKNAAAKAAVTSSLTKFSTDEALINQHAAALDNLAGRVARVEGRTADATKHFRAALSKYKKLGDKLMMGRLDVIREAPERPIERDVPDYLLELKATPKQLLLELYENDLKRTTGAIVATSIKPLLKLIKAEVRDRSALFQLSGLLINRTKTVGDVLGKIMFHPPFQDILKSRPPKPADFHLDSLSTALAKVPWEFATYKNNPISSFLRYFYRSASEPGQKSQSTKWLQLALNDLGIANLTVDGVLGPRTEATLSSLRKKSKWPASLNGAALMSEIGELLVKNKPRRNTRALIIRSKDQKSRTRSSSLLQWTYEDCYFSVHIAEADAKLKGVLRKVRPDVIHIESAFREVPGSGEIYLDFDQFLNRSSNRILRGDSIADSLEAQPLSPSLLNQALAYASETRLRPLVILDARSPATITEIVHQWLHRNAFAAQLFQGGQVNAVIAMGLSPNFDLYQQLVMDLVSNLSNTVTFGEITNSLRKYKKASNLPDRIATEGVALFTNEPWLTVLTPERRL